MKIASGTIFYNDCKSLKRTLDSLHDKMDYMICIDGRFKHFDGKFSTSWDGSRELVKSYDNAILLDLPDCYEVEKRQLYLDMAHELGVEFLLIIDSDEYVMEYNHEKFRQKLKDITEHQSYNQYNIFSVMLEVNSPNYNNILPEIIGTQKDIRNRTFQHYPRIIYKPGDVEYNTYHYFIRKKDKNHYMGKQETNPSIAIVEGMKLGHDHLLRNEIFLDDRKKYQTFLVDFEQKKLRRYKQINRKFPEIDKFIEIEQDNSLIESMG